MSQDHGPSAQTIAVFLSGILVDGLTIARCDQDRNGNTDLFYAHFVQAMCLSVCVVGAMTWL